MRPWLVILFLSLISDMIAAAVIAFQLKALTNGEQSRLVKVFSLFFLAVFLRGLLELCANAFGFVKVPTYSAGYAICYWSGRAIVTITIWYLLFVLISNRMRK